MKEVGQQDREEGWTLRRGNSQDLLNVQESSPMAQGPVSRKLLGQAGT